MLYGSIGAAAPPAYAHNRSLMATTLRRKDWSKTRLGPIATWPDNLKTLVGVVLDSPAPKLLLWGPELIAFYNDAYISLFGVRSMEWMGNSVFASDAGPQDGIGEAYPRFRPEMWGRLRSFEEAARSGTPQVVTELRTIRHANGVTEIAHATLSVIAIFESDGTVAGALVESDQTTSKAELRDALLKEHQEFRKLFDQAPVFLAFLSAPELRFESTNHAYRTLVGERDLLKKTVAEAFPELEGQGFIELLVQVCTTGQHVALNGAAVDLQRNRNGPLERRYVDFVYQPILDDEGVVTGILCAGSDVTDRQLAEQRGARLQIELLHASRWSAMATMAETIAHELNQPLTAASNYLYEGLQMLASPNGADANEARTAFHHVKRQIERSGEIVRSARRIVRDDSPRRENVALDALLSGTLDLVEAAGGCSSVEIQSEIAAQETLLAVDPIQVEQILMNLIRNACEAMRGCPKEVLSISSRKVGKKFVEIRLSDTGRGLPHGREDEMFSSFAPSARGGLGVGLSLSRTLVESHGGKIWAANNRDRGATFGFTLPLAQAARAAA